MLLLTLNYVPGKEIEALGIAKGTTVQTKNFGKDFMSGMKTLVGGELHAYTEMLMKHARLQLSEWSMKQNPSVQMRLSTSATVLHR